MTKKYTVSEFVKDYKDNGLNNIEVIDYISFIDKADICSRIVKNTYFSADKKYVNVNSAITYLLYNMTLIDEYTNIIVDFSNDLSGQFDALNQSSILSEIIDTKINPKEIKEFDMVMEMTKKDVMTNYYEPHGFISGQISKIVEGAKALFAPIVEKLSVNISEDKIKEFLKLVEENIE